MRKKTLIPCLIMLFGFAFLLWSMTTSAAKELEPHDPLPVIEIPFSAVREYDFWPKDGPIESPFASKEPIRDYLADMQQCCVTGELVNGAEFSRLWAEEDPENAIVFEDLFLLSKIICKEAGSSWLSMEWKMKVGEVLLNRVESPEFPDTIVGCAYQKGQYSNINGQKFKNLLPDEMSVEAAACLLSGERLIRDKSVVFQANFKQGSGVFEKLHDSKLGNTYLCYSNHPEIYQ